jgi:hypothetical protein
MSCHQHVYIGAAARVLAEPDNARDLMYTLTQERLWWPYNGNEDRLPYLCPNIDTEKYGVVFCYDREEAAPIVLNPTEIQNKVEAFYQAFREDLFRLSDAGFTLQVEYVALAYWL